jgi:hypothetical protein
MKPAVAGGSIYPLDLLRHNSVFLKQKHVFSFAVASFVIAAVHHSWRCWKDSTPFRKNEYASMHINRNRITSPFYPYTNNINQYFLFERQTFSHKNYLCSI